MPEPCPECNGTGYFAIDARGAHILDCDHCDGTGLTSTDDGPDCD